MTKLKTNNKAKTELEVVGGKVLKPTELELYKLDLKLSKPKKEEFMTKRKAAVFSEAKGINQFQINLPFRRKSQNIIETAFKPRLNDSHRSFSNIRHKRRSMDLGFCPPENRNKSVYFMNNRNSEANERDLTTLKSRPKSTERRKIFLSRINLDDQFNGNLRNGDLIKNLKIGKFLESFAEKLEFNGFDSLLPSEIHAFKSIVHEDEAFQKWLQKQPKKNPESKDILKIISELQTSLPQSTNHPTRNISFVEQNDLKRKNSENLISIAIEQEENIESKDEKSLTQEAVEESEKENSELKNPSFPSEKSEKVNYSNEKLISMMQKNLSSLKSFEIEEESDHNPVSRTSLIRELKSKETIKGKKESVSVAATSKLNIEGKKPTRKIETEFNDDDDLISEYSCYSNLSPMRKESIAKRDKSKSIVMTDRVKNLIINTQRSFKKRVTLNFMSPERKINVSKFSSLKSLNQSFHLEDGPSYGGKLLGSPVIPSAYDEQDNFIEEEKFQERKLSFEPTNHVLNRKSTKEVSNDKQNLESKNDSKEEFKDKTIVSDISAININPPVLVSETICELENLIFRIIPEDDYLLNSRIRNSRRSKLSSDLKNLIQINTVQFFSIEIFNLILPTSSKIQEIQIIRLKGKFIKFYDGVEILKVSNFREKKKENKISKKSHKSSNQSSVSSVKSKDKLSVPPLKLKPSKFKKAKLEERNIPHSREVLDLSSSRRQRKKSQIGIQNQRVGATSKKYNTGRRIVSVEKNSKSKSERKINRKSRFSSSSSEYSDSSDVSNSEYEDRSPLIPTPMKTQRVKFLFDISSNVNAKNVEKESITSKDIINEIKAEFKCFHLARTRKFL